MKFHSSVVFVSDIERSKDFYIRVLQQNIEHDFGTNLILEGGLSIWQIGKQHIINKQLKTQGTLNRFELYFENEKLDDIFTKLKNEAVIFLHELQEEPWGQRNIRFFDPDQHLIEIGEPLEVFVNNMHKNGLNMEQIAEKSGIPLETVKTLIV